MRIGLLALIILALCGSVTAGGIKITRPVRFLALGDSYTIGQSVNATESWPVQFTQALAGEGITVGATKIIAQTGWRTDNLMSAIDSQLPLDGYNLVSLLIGVNNQYQGGSLDRYAGEFEELLKTAIKLAGNSIERVFVLSIPDYAYTPFGNGNSFISSQLDKFNSVNRQITDKYGVCYIDITPISRNGLNRPELVASDGLHPSGKMYELWVNEIMKNIDQNVGIPERPSKPEPFGFSLYHRILTFTSEEEDTRLSIYSVAGELLQSEPIPGKGESRINLERLPPGVYLIRVESRGKPVYSGKIGII